MAVLGVAGAASRVGALSGRLKLGSLMVGTLVVSTFVWRVRSTTDLNSNPVDNAAAIRIALVLLAGSVALIVVAQYGIPRGLPGSFRMLLGYVAFTAMAAAQSPSPAQAGYRFLELAVGALVVVAVCSLEGDIVSGAREVVSTVVRMLFGILVMVWAEAIVHPSVGFVRVPTAAFRYELQGVFPSFSPNTVGTMGAVVALFGLTAATSRRRPLTVFGLVTLAVSQERTGVVAVAVVVALLALVRRRALLTAYVGGFALVLVAFIGKLGAFTGTAGSAFRRGENANVFSSLSGRTEYWSAAHKLINERPWLGWGVNVGSRRVLVSLGSEYTSNIHGAWVEALLGVGVIGASLLGLSLVLGIRAAFHDRRMFALTVLVFFAIRSTTGTTIELFNIPFLLVAGLLLMQDGAEGSRLGKPAPAV